MTQAPPRKFPISSPQPARGRIVMRQQWRDLLFLHWEVSPAQLRALLPAELTLDTFEGKAYVGLVPFTMRNVHPIWSPSIPPLSHFHETNVRTYAQCKGHDPGVWFFSLDAANAIAVQIARAWFKLPYYYARMEMQKTEEEKTEQGTGNREQGTAATQSTIHNPQSKCNRKLTM